MATMSTGNVHEPAAATAAVVTYTAIQTGRHVLRSIAWSYSAAPAAGSLKIENGSGNTVFAVNIVNAGWDQIVFVEPVVGSTNTDLIITLASGGSGVTGKLSITNHTTE